MRVLFFLPLSLVATASSNDLTCSQDESGGCIDEASGALNLLQAKIELHDSALAFKQALSKYVEANPVDPAVPAHAAAQATPQQRSSKIIMLGDSGSEYACTDIARFCGKSA